MSERIKLLEEAIRQALSEGYGTPDLKSQPRIVSTTELGAHVRGYVERA